MNTRQRRTLRRLFETPPRTDIEWNEVSSLLGAVGAEIKEGRGSRLRITLGDRRMAFHRPHRKEMPVYVVRELRDFLCDAGIEP